MLAVVVAAVVELLLALLQALELLPFAGVHFVALLSLLADVGPHFHEQLQPQDHPRDDDVFDFLQRGHHFGLGIQ